MLQDICKALLTVLLAIVGAWYSHTVAQNLVPNYSFEGHDTCFFNTGSIKHDPDFDTIVGVQAWLAPTLGNPDYYNSCNTNVTGANVPMNFVGYQYPKTGNAYVGFMNGSLVPNNIAQEYVQIKLNEPLKSRKKYCISVSFSNANRYPFLFYDATLGISYNFIMTSAFQLLFTNERVVDFEFDSSQWGLYSYNPQLHNNDTSVDTMNWRTAQWIYTAQGGEQWLTIGNFIPNEQLVWSAISPAPSDTEISYLYIDDVMVVNLDNAQIPTLNDTAICGTFSHTLDAQGGYEWYLWNTGATTQTINITTFGTYWVQCGATCGTFTDTIHIYDAALLDFSLPTPPSICSGLSTTYYTAPSFYSTYSWSTGATTQTIELAYPGDYRCTVTTGCSTFVDSMVVNLSNDADYQLELGADVDICKDGDNTVAILKTLNRKFDNYLWSTGDTTFYLITYNIGSFILEGSYHCGKSFDTITVVGCPPDDTYDLFVPNAFTPNSDEINDNFEIYHRNLSINMMRLYDRWGNKIFECNPCDNINWNGMYNGKLITGVIVYYIEATVTQSGRTISKKGNITVLQ